MFIINYFKIIIYHILTIIDGCVNTLGSCIFIKKIMDLSSDWLVFTETIRIDREMKARERKREKEAVTKIAALYQEAKENKDG